MRFGFVINEEKDPGFVFSKKAAEVVCSKGAVAVFDDSCRGSVLDGIPGVTFGSYAGCDILFSLGGDGTFLRTAHKYLGEKIPLIGVNLGTIGFLTESIKMTLKMPWAGFLPENIHWKKERSLMSRFFRKTERSRSTEYV